MENQLQRLRKVGNFFVKASEGKYFTCVSVWPFNFFPDSITLDEEKLTIVRRGFLTTDVIPIKIPDLLNIEIHNAPLFCTVEVVAKFVTARHEKIPYIRKSDGKELQKRCTELLIARHNQDSSGGQ